MKPEASKFVDMVIKKLSNSDLSMLEVECEGMKVKAERQSQNVVVQSAPIIANMEQPKVEEPTTTDEVKTLDKETISGHVVKSPIVGTCYLAPSPNDPPFVKVGDHVSKGETVLIVEAMKIMNEIESEFSGTVKEILVSNGELVEFGQPLVVIE